MILDFTKIRGSKLSIQENFEQLVCQILSKKFNAISINGSGGDGGIDCFTIANTEKIEIYQVKYFLNTLTNGQKQQIKKSLITASKIAGISKWILVIPHDYTPGEKKWFDALNVFGIELEWWGETILKNLLIEHPDISKQFFEEDRILQEFKYFINEIIFFSKIEQVKHHTHSPTVNHEIDSITSYLNRAKQITKTINEDADFINQSQSPLLAIDVCDLYYYIGTDSKYKIELPIADYCFENSPIPFTLLPESLIELKALVNHLRHKAQSRVLTPKNIVNETILADFINAYKTNPQSQTTKELFNSLVGEKLESVSAANGLNKLNRYLALGKLKFGQEEDILIENVNSRYALMIQNSYSSLVNRDNKDKYRILTNIYRDAVNLTYIEGHWNKSKNSVRMISSAPLFRIATNRIIGKENPVRNLHEFGYLLHSCFANESSNEERVKATLSIDGVQNQMESIFLDAKKAFSHNEELKTEFENFLIYYKTNLRPIDKMIQQGHHAYEINDSSNMHEFYNFLCNEYNLIKAFENWLDYIISILKSFENSLPINEKTLALLEQIDKKLER